VRLPLTPAAGGVNVAEVPVKATVPEDGCVNTWSGGVKSPLTEEARSNVVGAVDETSTDCAAATGGGGAATFTVIVPEPADVPATLVAV